MAASTRIGPCKADYKTSELDLGTTIKDIRARKPSLFGSGEKVVQGLFDAQVKPLSQAQDFETVAESVLRGVEQKSGTLSGRLASVLSKIAPLASIALGITSFAGDVCTLTRWPSALTATRHRVSVL